MSLYTPLENARRIREGLVSLIEGRSAIFEDASSHFIVVFDGQPSTAAGGRIHLFQQFFLDHLGIVPEVVRQVPACIKVFFNVGPGKNTATAVSSLLGTQEFRALCEDLNVSQVQFGSKMHYIRTANR